MASTASHQQPVEVAPHEKGFASARVQDVNHAADKLTFAPELAALRQTFSAAVTKDVEWRKQQLKNLVQAVKDMHEELTTAVRADLGGAKLRGVGELTVIDEAEHALANLDTWAAPQAVKNGTMENPNGSAEIVPTPKGVVLLISPWNYPIGLCLKPLVAIIAAGNCCLIKPSEVAGHCAIVVKKLVEKYLDPAAFRVVLGGVAETTALLRERYDHIVYTGNGDVARIILKAAAKHLTPCTLELGGKSPVIIDATADIALAAKRVTWGKWATNAGQTCIAPDYILIDRQVKQKFIDEVKANLQSYYGASGGPAKALDYGRIINSRHVGRLQRVLAQSPGGEVLLGQTATINADKCFVPPIILNEPSLEDAAMREEIFGPILPVVGTDNVEESINIVRKVCPRPLALYMFTNDAKTQQRILDETQSGAVVVNGCNFEQYANHHLPFGGVGESGTGQLHGEHGFRQVSHMRSVVHKSTSWPFTKLDLPPPPYKDDLYDNVVKLKYTGFISPEKASLLKTAGLGALLLAGAAVIRSRL